MVLSGACGRARVECVAPAAVDSCYAASTLLSQDAPYGADGIIARESFSRSSDCNDRSIRSSSTELRGGRRWDAPRVCVGAACVAFGRAEFGAHERRTLSSLGFPIDLLRCESCSVRPGVPRGSGGHGVLGSWRGADRARLLDAVCGRRCQRQGQHTGGIANGRHSPVRFAGMGDALRFFLPGIRDFLVDEEGMTAFDTGAVAG